MTTTPPFVTIVSGSPRNGTALMMQMLMAGGLEVLVDAVPKAGQPGPHGYFDYEPSLMLDVDSATTAWVAGALGKAVKVMPHQLQYLSPDVEYRVLFICRAVADALASWPAMGLTLPGSGPQGGEGGEPAHTAIEAELTRQPGMRVLFVPYREMTAEAAAQAVRVVDFLGLPLDTSAMAAAVARA